MRPTGCVNTGKELSIPPPATELDQTHVSHALGDFAVILSCMLWGIGNVFMKNVLGDTPDRMGVFLFNGLRLPIGVALLFATEKKLGRRVLLRKEHVRTFAALSFVGILNSLSYLFGLKLTTASNAGVLVSTAPLFILMISFITGIDRPTKLTIAGVIIGFLGALAVTYKGGELAFNPGDLMIVAACVFMGIFTVYAKRVLSWYSPMTTAGWIFLFLFLYQSPFFVYELVHVSWSLISLKTWINFTLSVVGPLYIANSLYYYSLHVIGPARVGLFNFLTPVFTLLFAYLILHESITVLQTAGLAVIIIGISITKKGPVKRPPFRV